MRIQPAHIMRHLGLAKVARPPRRVALGSRQRATVSGAEIAHRFSSIYSSRKVDRLIFSLYSWAPRRRLDPYAPLSKWKHVLVHNYSLGSFASETTLRLNNFLAATLYFSSLIHGLLNVNVLDKHRRHVIVVKYFPRLGHERSPLHLRRHFELVLVQAFAFMLDGDV